MGNPGVRDRWAQPHHAGVGQVGRPDRPVPRDLRSLTDPRHRSVSATVPHTPRNQPGAASSTERANVPLNGRRVAMATQV